MMSIQPCPDKGAEAERAAFTQAYVTEYPERGELGARIAFNGDAGRMWLAARRTQPAAVGAEATVTNYGNPVDKVDAEGLPPIEYERDMNRTYLPLPGGWEIQTKGKGSTFRIAHAPSRQRWQVLEDNLHEPLEALARDCRNHIEAIAADRRKQAALTQMIELGQEIEASGERAWQPVTRAGQVKVGDKLRFKIGDKSHSERAKLILHAGTDKEEVIYNKRQNYYFITAMTLSGFSNHKNVEFLAEAPKPKKGNGNA